MTPTRSSYSLRYRCSNCDYTWTQSFPVGLPATLMLCPVCKCLTGKKGW